MKVVKRGHIYLLDTLKPHPDFQEGEPDRLEVHFVNKEPGQEECGVTTQEILRMLIDRTHYCHNCLPHRVNEEIIWHFRMAIALHEARAIEQQVAKGEFRPELVTLQQNGHFAFGRRIPQDPEEATLLPIPPLGTFECDHRSHK